MRPTRAPRTNKPIAQLAIYALALMRLVPGLKVFDIECAWFNDAEYLEFFPRTLFVGGGITGHIAALSEKELQETPWKSVGRFSFPLSAMPLKYNKFPGPPLGTTV